LLRAEFRRDRQALGRPDLVAVRHREPAVLAGALVIAIVAKRSISSVMLDWVRRRRSESISVRPSSSFSSSEST